MVHGRLMLLLLAAPLLCATSIEQPAPEPGQPAPDLRDGLETYVYQLTALIDMQIEEIAKTIPPADVEKLRQEHYAWKLERDIQCAEEAQSTPGRLHELECLSVESEKYFERRELEISEYEKRLRKAGPGNQNAPPNKAMKSDVE